MRRSVFGTERFSFIIWWICNVDLYALISGAGTGEFVDAMIKNDMLPGPEYLLYPLGSDGCSVIYPEESGNLPAVLQLYYDTFLLAARLGFVAAEAREKSLSSPFAVSPVYPGSLPHLESWQRQVYELQHALRTLWSSPSTSYLLQHRGSLPRRSNEVLERVRRPKKSFPPPLNKMLTFVPRQASTMFHVFLLYSLTSLWPGQRLLRSGTSTEEEIHHHAAAILRIAEDIIRLGRFDRRFVIFPIFLAGATADFSSGLKDLATDLIFKLEQQGMGRNASTARLLLQIVYDRQAQQSIHAGHTPDVDWIDIMHEHEFQLVNFGL